MTQTRPRFVQAKFNEVIAAAQRAQLSQPGTVRILLHPC